MYAGHFATALILHRAAPRVPTWIPLVGVGLLDIINGVLTGVGIERVAPNHTNQLGYTLDSVDWDHSLGMAVLWAVLFALPWWRNRTWAFVAAAAVFSHFVLDLCVHDADLALWPGAAQHIGMQGWRVYPVGAWLAECAVSALAVGLVACARIDGRKRLPYPRSALVGLWMLSLNLTFSPWWSPLREAAARLPQAHAAAAYSVLILLGFVTPVLVLNKLLTNPQQRECMATFGRCNGDRPKEVP